MAALLAQHVRHGEVAVEDLVQHLIAGDAVRVMVGDFSVDAAHVFNADRQGDVSGVVVFHSERSFPAP